ncbi:LOW QUALITY PROTEIN: uncharacterized protein [Lepeophtheirus salmonis]|uniref:LOW QUALITY PROTEIN: uncharacterized protein n=1 Tax=Lepeophtheirus salmonis TaxID=72036 RepID=UPI003AF347B8
MSGNSVKAGEGSAPQITYSQQTGFPTIAPAPQQTTLGQGHQGIMSTHQGQFQVISSPPYGTSGAAQNAASATTQYIPQFATYNQQGQLVISPSNFPASAYGQHQIFLTAAPGMQQAQQTQQQAVQQQQVQQQQAAQHQQQQSNHQGGSAKGLLTTTQGINSLLHLFPSVNIRAILSLTMDLFRVTVRGSKLTCLNTSPLMTASQPGLFTSLSSNEAKNDSSKQGQSGLAQQNTAGATTAQAHQGSFIMHNGIAYMNPQHQQAILSSNGQIILRAPTSHETTQQPIMFSPSALTQQSHIQSPGATNQQQGQQQAGQQLSLAPPTLQPMSLSATNTAGTIRHVTTNSNNVSSQSGAPPGKTAISRALPTILPTTNVRPTYTLPQIPVSQASLQVNHQQQSSPKSKNKFSPRGGMGSSAGRQQPGKVNSSVGGATANSILKPSMVQQRATPPGTGTIMSSSPSPLSMGPPILSQQQPPVNSQSQPPVNSHSQPPTLQPMLTVASGGVSTTRTQLHSQYPSLITSAPSPSSGASATVLVSTSSSTLTSTKVLSTSSTASKSKTSSGNNNTLIKAKPPTSTPPPVSSSLNSSTTNGVTESGSVNNGSSGGSDTPKAFVKPNVLTHVIDGHIIQESSQPFSLEAGDDKAQNPGGVPKKESLTEESFSHKHNSSSNSISSPATTGTCVVSLSVSSGSSSTPIMTTTTATTTSTKSSTSSTNSSVTTGTTTHAEKKRGPGRPSGSTRQNIDNQRNPGSGNNQSSKGNNHHIKDGSGPPSEKRRKLTDDPIIKPLPLSTSNSVFGKNGNPLKWSVQQVCDFVKSLHGCAEYVEDFMLQEIDGQALMLLKTEHLMAAMSIKLGPALKICSAINEMREEVKQN